MFYDNFARFDDRGEIDRLIPLNKLSKVTYELLDLSVFYSQSDFFCGANYECM